MSAGNLSQVGLRLAREADLPQLAGLFRQEAEHHEALVDHFRLDPSYDWLLHATRALHHRDVRLFVAARGESLLAFLMLRLGEDSRRQGNARSRALWDPLLSRARRRLGASLRRGIGYGAGPKRPAIRENSAVIESMLVESCERRCGIGRQLVEHVLLWSESRHIERLELGVLVDNDLGRGFWRSLGFSTFRLQMALRIGRSAP